MVTVSVGGKRGFGCGEPVARPEIEPEAVSGRPVWDERERTVLRAGGRREDVPRELAETRGNAQGERGCRGLEPREEPRPRGVLPRALATDGDEPSFRVSPEGRVDGRIPVGENGERRHDAGLVARREETPERERRRDVAVRDEERPVPEEAALVRAPDAARRSQNLLLDGPCDGDARVRLPDGAAQLLREMVRVHDEGVRALPEEMVENVEEDWPAAEREEGFWPCECFGPEARAETGREDEDDHPA